jgi:hypothetical protein
MEFECSYPVKESQNWELQLQASHAHGGLATERLALASRAQQIPNHSDPRAFVEPLIGTADSCSRAFARLLSQQTANTWDRGSEGLGTESVVVLSRGTVEGDRSSSSHKQIPTNPPTCFAMAKPAEEFRNYKDSERQQVVQTHYRLMRENQTVEFVESMLLKYSFDCDQCRATMTIMEAFRLLETYVDSSDPDVSLPNLVHMLQTAEGIRKAGHPDWFQLVGLLHDMGKIMFLWGGEEEGQNGTGEGAQWALGGDTWVVGCKLPEVNVFPEVSICVLNPSFLSETFVLNPPFLCHTYVLNPPPYPSV